MDRSRFPNYDGLELKISGSAHLDCRGAAQVKFFGEVAGGKLTCGMFLALGHSGPTNILDVLAACMKAAARWRINRVGDFALQG